MGRLKSIARQTYPIEEIIILDDASTDDSLDRIRHAMAEVGRMRPEIHIKLIKNKQNSGKAMRQWLKGVEKARGDYIWIAEADDLARPKFLAEVMRGFDDAEVVLSYSESALINANGIMMTPNFRWSRDREKTGHYKKSYVGSGIDEIKEIMAIRCTIPNVSAVVFKKTPELIKGITEALDYAQAGDWYLYLRLVDGKKLAYQKKSLNLFRIHSGSVTNKNKNAKVHLDEIERIHKFLKDKYDLPEQTRRLMDAEMARLSARG